jgi:hypothetical protein
MEYSKQGQLLTQALADHPSGFPVASNGDLYFVTETNTLCPIHDNVVSTLADVSVRDRMKATDAIPCRLAGDLTCNTHQQQRRRAARSGSGETKR